MKYDIELMNILGNELVELWVETKVRCDKIEELVKEIKKK